MTAPLVKLAETLALARPPRPDLVEPDRPLGSPVDFSSLIESLVEHHWFVAENYLPASLCLGLRQELLTLHQGDQLTAAGIGRGREHQLARRVRGDFTHWLDGTSLIQQEFLALMRELKTELNRELFLGLFEYESHYAFYPPGAFYQKHLDAFRGRSNRVVTTVLYLNPDWQPGDAGEMRLYDPRTDQPLMDIPPRLGTLVCFLSEALPHEVLTTHKNRASIAGWFRVNTSINGQIDPAV